jgi:hypothetical protein
MKKTVLLLMAAVIAAIVPLSVCAGPKDPIVDEAFERFAAAQDQEFQVRLRSIFPEGFGFVVTGPMDPSFRFDTEVDYIYHFPRIICATADECMTAAVRLESHKELNPVTTGVSWMQAGRNRGLCGFVLTLSIAGEEKKALVLTHQQNRWLIWLRQISFLSTEHISHHALQQYSEQVVEYMSGMDGRSGPGKEAKPPVATGAGLPAVFDLLPDPPNYVINGYDKYKSYLHSHADIETYFADGILAFVPTDSLLVVLKDNAPETAWPNKEEPLIQHEYKKFFDRSGDVAVMKRLTAGVLNTLQPGEYFYAVGLNGTIRFSREIPREEIERLESETGREVPRANHAFLFPGEPVLTAGAFFVDYTDSRGKGIVKVNTHSGHYFYSNVSRSIRKDIAVRSDEYLLTIGHFFRALDREGITYEEILISKM